MGCLTLLNGNLGAEVEYEYIASSAPGLELALDEWSGSSRSTGTSCKMRLSPSVRNPI